MTDRTNHDGERMTRAERRALETTRRNILKLAAMGGLAGVLPGVVTYPNEAAAQARRGGTLTSMITPEPPIVVSGVNNQGPTLIVAGKLFEGLLTYSPRLEPQPGLAKSWTISPDGLTYVFNLQEGVTWHDGRPFSADDVVFSITKFAAELNPRSRAIFQRIASCEATTPNQVTIRLQQPFGPFILMFDASTTPIHAKHIYDGTDYRNNPANQNPVGTGPFRFGEWQRGNFIRFVKYDRYWQQGKPHLDEIVYRVIPDSNLRGVALQTGQVQLTSANDIEAFDVPRFRAEPNLEVQTAGWELFSPVMWIEVNHRSAPLGDVRVRRAMSMAVDRNFILNRLWFGIGKIATSPIASTTAFHDPSVRLPGFDVAAANRLLDEAGHPRRADGSRFELKYMQLPYGEIWTRLGEYLRQAFNNVGIRLVFESVDAGAWARKVAQWDYDLTLNFLYQFGDPTLGVERTYVSTNIQRITFTNTGGYSNPQVDALFQRAREAADPNVRRQAFSDVQKLLVEEMPQIWLLEMSFPTILDKRLRNVITTATGVHATFADVHFG
jgi:peptide/nickel transport system substrate-binding protein